MTVIRSCRLCEIGCDEVFENLFMIAGCIQGAEVSDDSHLKHAARQKLGADFGTMFQLSRLSFPKPSSMTTSTFFRRNKR